MNLRERVARAIRNAHVPNAHKYPWEELGPAVREAWLPVADAAMAEVFKYLEEPTELMRRRGAEVMGYSQYTVTGLMAADGTFRAMLRAAREEK